MPDNVPGADTGPETLRTLIADGLERARNRTHALTACDEEDLLKQHSPLMSPLVWDLAHVGSQEELWLVRDVGKMEPVRCDIDQMYDAFQHPRSSRPSLPLLSPEESRQYLAQVRDRALDILDRTPLEGSPLVDRGFAFGMIIQHEQQHDETMLATHQLRVGIPVLQARALAPDVLPADQHLLAKEVLIPAGTFMMGTSVEPWALDNERPTHAVDVPDFWIDTVPVTNGAYLRFIGDGGYRNPRWWTAQGWSHVREAGLKAPSTGNATVTGGSGPGSASLNRCRRMSRCSTCAGLKRMRMLAGPAAGFRPRQSGKRPRVMTPGPGVRGAIRGEMKIQRPIRRTLAVQPCGLPPPAPIRAEPHRWECASSSAMSGNGSPVTSAPTRDSTRSHIRTTAKCSSGLTTKCCAAGPGRRTQPRAGGHFGIGITRSDGKSSPDSAPGGTRRRRRCGSPCVVTSLISVPRCRWRSCCSTPTMGF